MQGVALVGGSIIAKQISGESIEGGGGSEDNEVGIGRTSYIDSNKDSVEVKKGIDS